MKYDDRITPDDIDNVEDAIAQFSSAWRHMVDVHNNMKGDCNEIISMDDKNTTWTVGSIDDVYHGAFQKWVEGCKKNIDAYRKHLGGKSEKIIRITRPAWIQETYKISSVFVGDLLPPTGKEIDPSIVRMYLEDHETIQLESEISCHMDLTNFADFAQEHDFADITLDEIEEVK